MNLEKLIAYYQAKLTNPVLTQESRVIATAALRELECMYTIHTIVETVNTLNSDGGFDMDADEGFEAIENILQEAQS